MIKVWNPQIEIPNYDLAIELPILSRDYPVSIIERKEFHNLYVGRQPSYCYRYRIVFIAIQQAKGLLIVENCFFPIFFD